MTRVYKKQDNVVNGNILAVVYRTDHLLCGSRVMTYDSISVAKLEERSDRQSPKYEERRLK